ncbi:MAG TPA: hypothetical protein VJ836_03935 [Candidatus Saccharimonadales bacterium]|nr:hypothetical protein [Candidatus Saccharimonadales bacterium]
MGYLLYNNQQSERGIGHLGVIVGIAVVLTLGGIGWFVYQKNLDAQKKDATTSINQATQEAIKNAKCEYNDKDICKFFTGWKVQEYYTVTSTSETEGQKATTTLKTEGNDKTHIIMTGAVQYEAITIGNTTYTKAGNTWYKQTAKPDTQALPEAAAETKVDLKEPEATPDDTPTPTYKKIGKEKCGDLTCFKYQVVTAGSDATEYIWFDDSSYQLRRMQTLAGSAVTYDASFNYDRISIKTPSPVTELGPNQYIMPGQTEPVTLPETGDISNYEELLRSYQNAQ